MRIAIAVWLLVVGAGVAALVRYDSTPAAAHVVDNQWPSQSLVSRDAGRPTLILAVHPECSCTHATMAELARMLPRLGNRTHIVVLLLGRNGNRYQSSVEEMHLDSFKDADGSEARRFGLTTSGEVALYGADGKLLYTGGITGSRAHEGDNPGEEAVIAAVNGGENYGNTAPVFGCELHNKE